MKAFVIAYAIHSVRWNRLALSASVVSSNSSYLALHGVVPFVTSFAVRIGIAKELELGSFGSVVHDDNRSMM